MKIMQSLESLSKNVGADALSDVALALFNDGSEASSVHVLQEKPKSLLIVVGLKALQDALVIAALLHHSKLIFYQLPFLFIFWLHKLESAVRTIRGSLT